MTKEVKELVLKAIEAYKFAPESELPPRPLRSEYWNARREHSKICQRAIDEVNAL